MATLSILEEDGILVTCANPIYPTSPVDSHRGAKITFEVLEVDASSLKRLAGTGRMETFVMDPHQFPFSAELTTLEPCTSTVPALSLLRDRPAMRGVLTVHGVIGLVGQQKNRELGIGQDAKEVEDDRGRMPPNSPRPSVAFFTVSNDSPWNGPGLVDMLLSYPRH